MNVIYQIIVLLFIHLVADFTLQSRKMAIGKSSNLAFLFIHALIYSYTFFIVGIFFFPWLKVLLFTNITLLFHFSTDYFTSKLTSKKYKKKHLYGVTGFFPIIGYDQFLHCAQLIICYHLILS